MLALAGVLYVLALVLPVDNAGRVSGISGLGFIALRLMNDHGNHLGIILWSAILLANVLTVLVIVALLVGGRALARALAGLALILAWGVSATFTLSYPNPLREFLLLLQNGPGAIAWFASLTALVAATFLWPSSEPRSGDDR